MRGRRGCTDRTRPAAPLRRRSAGWSTCQPCWGPSAAPCPAVKHAGAFVEQRHCCSTARLCADSPCPSIRRGACWGAPALRPVPAALTSRVSELWTVEGSQPSSQYGLRGGEEHGSERTAGLALITDPRKHHTLKQARGRLGGHWHQATHHMSLISNVSPPAPAAGGPAAEKPWTGSRHPRLQQIAGAAEQQCAVCMQRQAACGHGTLQPGQLSSPQCLPRVRLQCRRRHGNRRRAHQLGLHGLCGARRGGSALQHPHCIHSQTARRWVPVLLTHSSFSAYLQPRRQLPQLLPHFCARLIACAAVVI